MLLKKNMKKRKKKKIKRKRTMKETLDNGGWNIEYEEGERKRGSERERG